MDNIIKVAAKRSSYAYVCCGSREKFEIISCKKTYSRIQVDSKYKSVRYN